MKKSELNEKWWFRLIKVAYGIMLVAALSVSIIISVINWPKKEAVAEKSYFKCFIQTTTGSKYVFPFVKSLISSYDVNDDDTLNESSRDSSITTCRTEELAEISAASLSTSTPSYESLVSRYGDDSGRSSYYINDENDINYELHVYREYSASRFVYALESIGTLLLIAALALASRFVFYYVVCGNK